MSVDMLYLEEGKAIRDPIWGYIYVPREMMALIDSEDYQRLRDLSQLGHVMLVYPGARHSRFEHSLGVFHIAKRFLFQLLRARPPVEVDQDDVKVLLAGALLHDLGHYPFSHILEELHPSFVPHERRGRRIIEDPDAEIHQALRGIGIDPGRVANVIDFRNRDVEVPPRDLLLAHILSGPLDPDKIDYLLRDSRYCGIPFGESVNRDRLIGSITFDPVRQRPAITHKGVSAMEALVFTHYLMYRNVYWHHTVRAATAMFKRGVQDLLLHPRCGLGPSDFERVTESELTRKLHDEVAAQGARLDDHLLGRLRRRRLYKVARVFFPHEREQAFVHYFYELYNVPEKRREKEIELCRVFGQRLGLPLKGDEVLIDIPSFTKTPQVDLKVFFGPHIPVDRDDPLSFDDPEVSGLKESFVDNFEAQAKVFRVYCIDHAGLREALKQGVKNYLP
ncbi:MAG: hypothetical protein A3F84_16320 [Candidatus Handelsmanbacteria bacterium RIFCSPLOWO2_12_FULL_64_10]|uniref:HD/PDEase domain-containing protein n=1 Tax=Handelsmanbacteria sp. (strain RIFCSPLOWO2_12_FULL_64_10) TaxID=1817868 RepID=A0A1F6CHM1_HANXR|nr:MAG: hypothetical protein A3F84_16320 [Candidatus Handelsmanbacteria bacterium RIFCSPLOWO2_12_FULL_64_10]